MGPLYILGLTLSIFIIIFSIIFFKKGMLGIKGLLYLIVISIGIGFMSIYPKVIDFFLETLSISFKARGLSVLAIAIFIIFITLYFQFISQKKIIRNISLLIQELSLIKYKLEKTTDKKS